MRPQISDDQLIETVEKASDQHGSKSEAVRYAIEETYLNEDNGTETQITQDDSRSRIEKAHQILRKNSIENKIEMEMAKNLLAQEFQLDSNTIKSTLLRKLDRQNKIKIESGMRKSAVIVKDPDPSEELGEVERLTRDQKISFRILWKEVGQRPRIDQEEAVDLISDNLNMSRFESSNMLLKLDQNNAITIDLSISSIIVRDPDRDVSGEDHGKSDESEEESNNDEKHTNQDPDKQPEDLHGASRADGGDQ